MEIKREQIVIREETTACEKEIIQIEKNIKKFTAALEQTNNIEAMDSYVIRIGRYEKEIEKAKEKLVELKIETERLNIKYAGTEEENMYYNVKDRIHNFFKKLNIEEQRNELIKTIKKCVVMGTHIIIDSGANVFIF
ncbi:MAG: hypothetical protein LBQ88_07845, partial [Treponema sp.]|nr:hypothetical protein [Treponema sp.]